MRKMTNKAGPCGITLPVVALIWLVGCTPTIPPPAGGGQDACVATCQGKCGAVGECTCDDCGAGKVCEGGVCVESSPACADKTCDDGNPCTTDSCDPATGECLVAQADGTCDDGNPCTLNDTCAKGECVGGEPLQCEECGWIEDAGRTGGEGMTCCNCMNPNEVIGYVPFDWLALAVVVIFTACLAVGFYLAVGGAL